MYVILLFQELSYLNLNFPSTPKILVFSEDPSISGPVHGDPMS